MCVNGFIVNPPHPPTPIHTHTPSVYFALRANDQVRRSVNIHLHYITSLALPREDDVDVLWVVTLANDHPFGATALVEGQAGDSLLGVQRVVTEGVDALKGEQHLGQLFGAPLFRP